ADAVEVHHAGDPRQLAALPRLGHEAARADQPDLLGAEGDELQRARVRPTHEPLGDAAQSLDAGRVVDRAVAAPDRVEVSADDHDLLALAGQLRDDVPIAPAGH